MRSNENVYWVARLAIHEGQEDAFRSVVEEMCAATAKEPGALNYEWSLSEDGRTCHVLERYIDSDAVRAHMESVGPFIERFTAAVDIVGNEVYGSPDAAARESLTAFGATFNRPFAGFVR